MPSYHLNSLKQRRYSYIHTFSTFITSKGFLTEAVQNLPSLAETIYTALTYTNGCRAMAGACIQSRC